MSIQIPDTPSAFVDVEGPSSGETDRVQGGSTASFPGKFLQQLAQRDRFLYDQALGGDDVAIASFATFKQAGIASLAQGRLTLETGIPVSSVNQVAKTTLYYTPYNGDVVALFDTVNSRWDAFNFSELGLSLSGLAADTNHDIFLYNNNGTLTMQAVAWSDSSAGSSVRASAITQLNGIWVKDSDKRRYLGTIRITGTPGQCEDSFAKRFVWNSANRAPRKLFDEDDTTHTYNVSTYRPWNNSTSACRVEFVYGLATELVAGTSNIVYTLGDGQTVCALNTTTDPGGNSPNVDFATQYNVVSTSNASSVLSGRSEIPPLGFNYFLALENTAGSITTTFNLAKLSGTIFN
ncbi:MAG: hypothetical protein AAGA75_20565 [Cyanobacteria bacterium P01_E01_bin.6]